MARSCWLGVAFLLAGAAVPAEAALLAPGLTEGRPLAVIDPVEGADGDIAPALSSSDDAVQDDAAIPLPDPAIAGWMPLAAALVLIAYRMRRADGRTRFQSAV
ncbi:hypothetical protein SAMN06295912_108159 [Sphingomonas laterariae]|uniref:MYXO-CTERM domain-containing protein n=1 Tax=Edaphosphingomonas laterariae TaxID=861865 RepID=A0A239FCX0_9SPHN|nr:hypothetical protein SAMN06295912_108159 [Sphingomonas laterariae]